jgi:CDP-glucose 4,6-dehydratase
VGLGPPGEVTRLVAKRWGSDLDWVATPDTEFHEASLLALDARKSENQLGWTNYLGFQQAVEWTVDWYLCVREGISERERSGSQISKFSDLSSGSIVTGVRDTSHGR